MVFRHLSFLGILFADSSIFTTLGFTLIKLRFAGHKACSREPHESSKRAVRELLESLWELLGGPWGSLGLSWALLGCLGAVLGLHGLAKQPRAHPELESLRNL